MKGKGWGLWVLLFVFLFNLPAFANNWEDFFKNAYCVVDGTKIKVGNVVIGNTSYFAEFGFNPQTLSYQFSDYAVQNDDDSFLSIKDLYSKAFSVEVVDSNSPELAEFDTSDCQEIWKYRYGHSYNFLCFTSHNYRLLGMIFDNGVKLITLEAEGLPLYLSEGAISVERAKFRKIYPDNREVTFEATVAIEAHKENDTWEVNVFFAGPSTGYGSVKKYVYDLTTQEVKAYKAAGSFEEIQ